VYDNRNFYPAKMAVLFEEKVRKNKKMFKGTCQ
jgi:hypothetical protein